MIYVANRDIQSHRIFSFCAHGEPIRYQREFPQTTTFIQHGSHNSRSNPGFERYEDSAASFSAKLDIDRGTCFSRCGVRVKRLILRVGYPFVSQSFDPTLELQTITSIGMLVLPVLVSQG